MTRKDPTASALTNGSKLFLENVDGRTAWPRRFRDLVEIHHADLGGADELSEGERQIVRRAATLEVELERLESEFAVAGEANPERLDLYIRAAGALKRLHETIGLQRRPRDVTPTLAEVIESRRRAAGGDA